MHRSSSQESSYQGSATKSMSSPVFERTIQFNEQYQFSTPNKQASHIAATTPDKADGVGGVSGSRAEDGMDMVCLELSLGF